MDCCKVAEDSYILGLLQTALLVECSVPNHNWLTCMHVTGPCHVPFEHPGRNTLPVKGIPLT